MHLQHGTFQDLHEWCVMQQDTTQSLRDMNKDTGAGSSSKKTGGGGDAAPSSGSRTTKTNDGKVRILPFKYQGMGKLADNPAEAARIEREGRCMSCREQGHTSSQDPKCVFNRTRGAFKFGNVYKETTIEDFNAGKNKPNGNAQNNTMQLAAVHDDDQALPLPKDRMIEGAPSHHGHQGNATHRR